MLQRLIARTVSLCLSVLITLAMLGGIDQLSRPDEGTPGSPQWVQVPAPRA